MSGGDFVRGEFARGRFARGRVDWHSRQHLVQSSLRKGGIIRQFAAYLNTSAYSAPRQNTAGMLGEGAS